MIFKYDQFAIGALAIALLLFMALGSQAVAQELLPSKAVQELRLESNKASKAFVEKHGKISTENIDDFRSVKKNIVNDIYSQMLLTDLDDSEKVILLDFYHLNSNYLIDVKMDEIYLKFVLDKKAYSYDALDDYFRTIQKELVTDDLIAKIEEFWTILPPAKDAFGYLAGPVTTVAINYAEAGDQKASSEFLLKYINQIPADGPRSLYNAISYYYHMFVAVYGIDKTKIIIEDMIKKSEQGIEESQKRPDSDGDPKKWAIKRWQNTQSRLKRALKSLSLVGNKPVDIEFSDFINTATFTAEELKGKVVMVDFFANWCTPCKEAFPHLKELQRKYQEQGFEIISVSTPQGFFQDPKLNLKIRKGELSFEDELKYTKQLVEAYEMSWPVVFTSGQTWERMQETYGLQGIPAFLLLDKEGNIAMFQTGTNSIINITLENKIEKLLNQK